MTIEDQAPEGFRPDSGYRPELKRTLGPFQVFAISFAFISVAVGALAWSAFVLFVLVSPSEALLPVVIVVGLLIVGGLYFGYLLRFRREVLQTEPGDVSVFKH
jgi:hypothetical protein